jgi:hypothetical protein
MNKLTSGLLGFAERSGQRAYPITKMQLLDLGAITGGTRSTMGPGRENH